MIEKNLIVYYSYSGNTKTIAEIIKSKAGGDILRLDEAEKYPDSYNQLLKQAKEDIQSESTPAIKIDSFNIEDYTNVFIGSPNWWNNIAPPLRTFLRQNDLSDKSIYPFCTHGGGGSGRIFEEIAKESKSADVRKGLTIYSDGGGTASVQIENWLSK